MCYYRISAIISCSGFILSSSSSSSNDRRADFQASANEGSSVELTLREARVPSVRLRACQLSIRGVVSVDAEEGGCEVIVLLVAVVGAGCGPFVSIQPLPGVGDCSDRMVCNGAAAVAVLGVVCLRSVVSLIVRSDAPFASSIWHV